MKSPLYMFKISVTEDIGKGVLEYTVKYFTNYIMSKNDGALITFTDHNGERQSLDPLSVSIDMNVNDDTHIAEPIPEWFTVEIV